MADRAVIVGTGPTGHAVRGFAGLPHRVALVGEARGVRSYEDLKATAR